MQSLNDISIQKCSTCLIRVTSYKAFECQHIICQDCMKDNKGNQNQCPQCHPFQPDIIETTSYQPSIQCQSCNQYLKQIDELKAKCLGLQQAYNQTDNELKQAQFKLRNMNQDTRNPDLQYQLQQKEQECSNLTKQIQGQSQTIQKFDRNCSGMKQCLEQSQQLYEQNLQKIGESFKQGQSYLNSFQQEYENYKSQIQIFMQQNYANNDYNTYFKLQEENKKLKEIIQSYDKSFQQPTQYGNSLIQQQYGQEFKQY